MNIFGQNSLFIPSITWNQHWSAVVPSQSMHHDSVTAPRGAMTLPVAAGPTPRITIRRAPVPRHSASGIVLCSLTRGGLSYGTDELSRTKN